MTTIQDLPEEILYIIFKDPGLWSLSSIQLVCRAWYIPAHVTFLNEVRLEGVPAIKKFINSIDANPHPLFLKAVKSIEFVAYTTDDPSFQLNDEINQKLFYRFPNLEKVELQTSTFLEGFNDEISKTFMMNCPKLKSFYVYYDMDSDPKYRDLAYKAKLIMTEIDTDVIEDVSQYGDITKYLSSFPRLRMIHGYNSGSLFSDFKQLLTVLPHTPLLTSIHLGTGNDNENAAQKYLLSTPKDTQDALINQLSKIDYINLNCTENFCVNSLKFVLKYLTGLKDIFFCNELAEAWTAAHTKVFCSLMAELPRFKDYNIQIYRMDLEALSKCFPAAVRKVFPLAANQEKTRAMKVKVGGTVDLCIRLYDKSIDISLYLDNHFTLSGFSRLFFKSAYNNVDEFKLEFRGRDRPHDNLETNLHMYNSILGQMPSLKKVMIDITAMFVDKGDTDDCEIELPLVEELTIRATADATFQCLLNSYGFALPNLKRLTFYYYSGIWEEDIGVFHLKLQRYSLETLCLDVTPVKKKTDKILNKEVDGFFVMEVEVLSTNERHMYKLSTNLSSVTRLKDGDLKGFLRGEDYFLVRITIKSLQNLKVFAEKGPHKEVDDNYFMFSQSLLHVMLLENNRWKKK